MERSNRLPINPALPLQAPQSAGDLLRRRARLARKELRESLRDRRTLATLIMMPLIVYPLLGSVVQKFAVSRIDPNAPAAVVVIGDELSHDLQQSLIQTSPGEPASNQPSPSGKTESIAEPQGLDEIAKQVIGAGSSLNPDAPGISLKFFNKPVDAEPESLISNGLADVAIRTLPPKVDSATGRVTPGEVRILSRRNDPFSARAAEEVEKRVLKFRDGMVRRLLSQIRFGVESMPLVSKVSLDSTAPKESPLSAFVPLMLVLMTMTGAVYPAIDLTAGERERGTLEMLLAAPVPRRDLLLAKFAAVFTVAVLTAVINLTAMILTLYGTGFDRVILGDGASLTMFLQVLALLIVFASFFSAVLLSITSFARSFREAQAWLIPLMLVSLAPGILSLMPGVRLTIWLALVPLVNIVLLGKELFQGIAAPELFVVTLIATATYTILALRLAAQIFGSDSVLFGSDSRTGRVGSRPLEFTDQVSFKLGMGCLVVLTPALLVLAGLRGRLVAVNNLSAQLVLSGVIMILLFAALPVALTVWNRVRFVPAFGTYGFHPLTLLGAMLLGATMWTLTYEVLLFGKGDLGWAKLLDNPVFQEMALRLTRDTPLLLRLITLAAIPAICEELFFRGFLMNALLGKSVQWKNALFISTLVFAAFHVVVDQSQTFERFPGTFLLGFVLGCIRLSTGSIFPGIAMHAISNGLLLSLTDLQPLLARMGLDPGVRDATHLPGWFLATSATLALAGAGLVWAGSRNFRTSPHDSAWPKK